jgi:hypothetical protein
MAEIMMFARAGAEWLESRKEPRARQIFAQVRFGFFAPIP